MIKKVKKRGAKVTLFYWKCKS